MRPVSCRLWSEASTKCVREEERMPFLESNMHHMPSPTEPAPPPPNRASLHYEGNFCLYCWESELCTFTLIKHQTLPLFSVVSQHRQKYLRRSLLQLSSIFTVHNIVKSIVHEISKKGYFQFANVYLKSICLVIFAKWLIYLRWCG